MNDTIRGLMRRLIRVYRAESNRRISVAAQGSGNYETVQGPWADGRGTIADHSIPVAAYRALYRRVARLPRCRGVAECRAPVSR